MPTLKQHLTTWMRDRIADALDLDNRIRSVAGATPAPAVVLPTVVQPAGSGSVAAWMRDRCIYDSQAVTEFADLHTDYTGWCAGNGTRPLCTNWFGRCLSCLGVGTKSTHAGTHHRRGIRLAAKGEC
jgi:hypothetical protein